MTFHDNVNTSQYVLKSVDNALAILDLLCAKGKMSTQDIACSLGVSKSAAFRLLVTLERRAFVARDTAQLYCLGPKIAAEGAVMSKRGDLASFIHPFLVELSENVQDTCHASTLVNGNVLFIDTVLGKSLVHVQSAVGKELPAHLTSSGKSMLAFLDEPQIKRYISSASFEHRTPNSISNGEELHKQLVLVREYGFAIDSEELEIGQICYGMPVLGPQGAPVAALCVSGPAERMRRKRADYVRALREATERAARALG